MRSALALEISVLMIVATVVRIGIEAALLSYWTERFTGRTTQECGFACRRQGAQQGVGFERAQPDILGTSAEGTDEAERSKGRLQLERGIQSHVLYLHQVLDRCSRSVHHRSKRIQFFD